MKAMAILWNSMNEFSKDAIDDIGNFAIINEIWKIDFQNRFPEFISNIYPYQGAEKWKLEYKINHMYNQYNSNRVTIMFIDIKVNKRKYIERKNQYIYEEVEELKKFIRNKYKDKVSNYAFDNVFHMTDNYEEYISTLSRITNYLSSLPKKEFDLNDICFSDVKILPKTEQHGKRTKFEIFDGNYIYKEAKPNTMEDYAEVFFYNFLKQLNVECAEYFLCSFKSKKGVCTRNFIAPNEILLTGTQLIDSYLSYNEINSQMFDYNLRHDIRLITKYNNFEDIIIILHKLFDNSKVNIQYIVEELKKIYCIDLLFLQSDRNSSNWGILYNLANSNIKLAPFYDNSGIFKLNNALQVENLTNNISKSGVFEIMYQNINLLRINRSDDIFCSQLSMINKIDDEFILNYLNQLIYKIEGIGLNNLIEKSLVMSNINSDIFKRIITNNLSINIDNIKKMINRHQKKLVLY